MLRQTLFWLSVILVIKTQEVKVGNKNSYSIQLQDDTEVLDEVVVVGYGVQKKSSLTGAVASISSQEISKQVSSNVASKALQGRTPGVDIVQQKLVLLGQM